MAISLSSLRRGGVFKPPRVLIYGVEGVGKTNFAASAPKPVFLRTEKDETNANTIGWSISSFDDAIEAMGVLYNEAHEFETVVTDSLDWLEPLIWEQVCKDNDVKSIEDIGYGKGYVQALVYWGRFIEGMNALRDERNMTIIWLAHSTIKRFDAPDTDPYDRFQVKLHERASAKIREVCDIVGFANYHVAITKTEVGFDKKVARGTGAGIRYLHLEERPAFQAKNRYDLPAKIKLPKDSGWTELVQHFPNANPDATPEAAE